MRKERWKSSPRPSTSIEAGSPEVFELTTAPGRRTRSMRAYTSCLMSSRSTTASTIQSTSPSLSKSSSVLPTVTNRASPGSSSPRPPPLPRREYARPPLGPARAVGCRAEPPAAGLEIVQQRRDEAAARGAEWMAQRDGAAVRIQLVLVDAELAHHGQRLCSKGLVEFDHIDVGKL